MARPLAGLIPALALTGAWTATAVAGAPPADRYGPSPAAPLPDVYAGPSAARTGADAGRETGRAPPARWLTWPGKGESAAGPSAPPADPPAYLRSARATEGATAAASYPAPRYAPSPSAAPAAVAVSPRFAAPVPSPATPPPPYFAAPTPGTPPPASTSLSGPLASAGSPVQHARLYSVHRAYGMQPDPAPIPPQFFAQTADLSTPATADPIPSRAANAATRNAVNAARLAAAEAN